MLLSISRNLEKIGPSGRRFITFTTVNIVACQCVSYPALLVLFARHIEMPPALVGLILSFVPLSATLVIFTNPLVERLGPRRLMMRTWVVRNLLFSTIFLMPFAMSWGGKEAAWAVLIFAILGFSLTRAIGMGGWMPWLHEVLPDNSRGMYFGFEMSLNNVMNILLVLIIAIFLGKEPTVGRFLAIMAFGVALGLYSENLIKRIPGGERTCETERPIRVIFGEYRKVAADRKFLGFVILVAWGLSSLGWLLSASVLFMRDVLHYSSNHILFISSCSALGVTLTVGRWGKFADEHGSGRMMSLSLAGVAFVSLGWFALVPGEFWTDFLIWPVMIFTSIFGAAFWAGTNCAMLANLPDEERIPYSNVWVIGRAATNGIIPIIAGLFIQHFDIYGYMVCFCLGMISSASGAIAILRIRDDGRSVSLRAILRQPARPLYVLSQIGGILLGPEDMIALEKGKDLPKEDELEDVGDAEPAVLTGTAQTKQTTAA